MRPICRRVDSGCCLLCCLERHLDSRPPPGRDATQWNIGTYFGYKRPALLTWRLRPETLMDAPFTKAVRDELAQYFEVNWGTSTTRDCDWEAMKVVIRGLCVQATYGVRCQLEKDILDHEARLRDLEKCLLMQLQKMEEWRFCKSYLLPMGSLAWDRIDPLLMVGLPRGAVGLRYLRIRLAHTADEY
ncbi:hypothetical protein NDU88_006086 [Pleurodeles waltl]|uniref:Uncharacterized protein n=1 Tax=Pleurodeles waltl TaxID=8319 RepID=A0AAV7LN25_PLEWA|nr:hypothetical protein NDU88_006086 [Pleurodeles waltl]